MDSKEAEASKQVEIIMRKVDARGELRNTVDLKANHSRVIGAKLPKMETSS